MKIKDLAEVLRSPVCGIQSAVVYNSKKCKDIENGCSVEYIKLHYGDREVYWITAEDNKLVFHIRQGENYERFKGTCIIQVQ